MNYVRQVDGVDRRLIAALRTNARATYAELARLVGLSAPAVHERVGKLESAGVITPGSSDNRDDTSSRPR